MANSSFNRELSVSSAKLADQAQCYDEMAEIMKNVAKSVAKLTSDERILLSKAYEKKISSRRAYWQLLSSELEKELEKEKTDLMREYLERVEAEMNDICKDILSILDQHLIPSCKIGDHMSRQFYYEMKGDYYLYLAEFKFGCDKRKAAMEAIRAYDSSREVVLDGGLAIDFSALFGHISYARKNDSRISEILRDCDKHDEWSLDQMLLIDA